jgi:hypothetical protein
MIKLMEFREIVGGQNKGLHLLGIIRTWIALGKKRKEAGQGFDSGRSGNLRGRGVQYIPTPQPKIDKDVKN